MAKLTSEQRNNLPEDVFGIPEDRAYPMPDEAHVRSAITYFHACPRGKKKELADNINRMAKKYNMKVSLKPHSPFKPYADKETSTGREKPSIIRVAPSSRISLSAYGLKGE